MLERVHYSRIIWLVIYYCSYTKFSEPWIEIRAIFHACQLYFGQFSSIFHVCQLCTPGFAVGSCEWEVKSNTCYLFFGILALQKVFILKVFFYVTPRPSTIKVIIQVKSLKKIYLSINKTTDTIIKNVKDLQNE